jgi:hydrogenase/urease accessory protein HupE
MFWNFIQIGFEHVIPLGYDHILFIVALFFFNSHLKSAVIQCTLFTIAHSLTLALVTLEYVHVNTKWVEVVIALSIFVMAFENIFQPKLKSWRLVLIFIFGLIHGMGFASALRDFGLPQNELVISLLGFNCGVELAQVTVILACYFGIARWMIKKDWYHKKLVTPLSLLISTVAIFLAIGRFVSI